jgi:hypothetical protein
LPSRRVFRERAFGTKLQISEIFSYSQRRVVVQRWSGAIIFAERGFGRNMVIAQI